MKGKLYGIGVGPGDPELMTLKALKVIQACDVIAVPGKVPQDTVAYQIALGACPDIERKELLGIYMPMTKDEEQLRKSHKKGIEALCTLLESGKKIAFLTLGDPTVYATYIYLHQGVEKKGYETEIISGIPSFCAAAAKLNIGIVEKQEQLHVIPASYPVEDALRLPGTKILMKSGKKLSQVKTALREYIERTEKCLQILMVENCGMEGERVFSGLEEIPEDAGYYTLIFVKERE